MTDFNYLTFPFTAVAGQEPLKLALILCAINPRIGGVLISGPRGSAKSTLARGLSDVMPAFDADHTSPFATLPLGASEDRLLGAIDLEKVLNDKTVAFNPGVLAKAHGGILYVDEVNLLADNLVDQLLDVAASGVNRIERDGISHEHESRFLLVGTMNPEEGELRPQLKDRFGLMAMLSSQYSLEERVQIVRLREEFDQNPKAFRDAFKYKQKTLKQNINTARSRLHKIKCPDSVRMDIASRCHDANVDGVRADIVWVRAAQAYAAWCGADIVSLEDVQAVSDLVLAHRRQTPPVQKNNQGDNGSSASSRPPSSRRPPSTYKPDLSTQDTAGGKSQAASDKDWGGFPPEFQSTSNAIRFDLQGAGSELSRPSHALSTKILASGKQSGSDDGGYRTSKQKKSNAIDWTRTLTLSPHKWPPTLVQTKAKTGHSVLNIILLDTSASVLGHEVFAKAKGVILDVSYRAYLAREQLSILGFGNESVETLLEKVRSPKDIESLLDSISAGGNTPLGEALWKLEQEISRYRRQSPSLEIRAYILTDGRSQIPISDLPNLDCELFWLDTELASIKRGRGPQLSEALGANYFTLAELMS